MINQQLLDYVRAQKSAGLTKEAIIQALSAGGWTTNDVNEAYMALEGVKTPPPAPPQNLQAAQPAAPRTIVPPIQMEHAQSTPPVISTTMPGSTPAQAMTTPAPAPRPVAAASEYSTAAVKKGHMGLWVTLTFIILLLVGGAVAAVAFFGVDKVISFIPGMQELQTPVEEITPAPTLDTIDNSATTTVPTDVSTTTASSSPNQ